MIETYVKIVRRHRKENQPDTYCPIDLVTHTVIYGLALIGSVPEGAEIVGEYNEDTNELTLSSDQLKRSEK